MSFWGTDVYAVYALLYAALCLPSMLYLWRRGAERKTQVGVFIGFTVPFIFAVLRKAGFFSWIDSLVPSVDGATLLITAATFVFQVGIMAALCYRLKSLGAFVLGTIALVLLYTYPYITVIGFERGIDENFLDLMSNTTNALIVILLIGSCIVGLRDYLRAKEGGPR